MKSNQPYLSGWPLFLMTVAVILLGLIVASFLTPLVSIGANERTTILWGSALQGIFVFIIPSLLSYYMSGRNPIYCWGIDHIPSVSAIAGIIIVLLISMPAMNQIIYWNDNASFPESMSYIEQMLRGWEEKAASTTSTLLNNGSLGALFSGLLVIGLLTGVAEELFFRGLLQPAFIRSGLGNNLAIWLTAFVFSAIHFQFFGFFPRLLLGAFFGYLYLWSGTVWSSIIAHTLNNSIVVVSGWISYRQHIDVNPEDWGVISSGLPIWFIISAILTFCFLYIWRRNWAIKKITDHG